MTTFIYDTKSIMKRAWVLARELRAYWKTLEQRHSKWRACNMNLMACFAESLGDAWKEAKEAMVKAKAAVQAKTSPRGRYLELLSVAERDGLNHGKSWYCGEREIETMGMNPMHEGQLVCYVYAN